MMKIFVAAAAFAAFAMVSTPAQAQDVGKAKYDMFCTSCHGATGKGDGPAGSALNPKPRDLTDAAWQKSVTDELIAKAIKEGGAAIGKSPLMPPWGHSLNEEELKAVVAYVRSMGAK